MTWVVAEVTNVERQLNVGILRKSRRFRRDLHIGINGFLLKKMTVPDSGGMAVLVAVPTWMSLAMSYLVLRRRSGNDAMDYLLYEDDVAPEGDRDLASR